MEARGMETQEGRVLKRGLKRRHLTMIAIGGSIGTGLFLAMGGTIRDAGPGGAMVAYAVMGIVVYFMMTALGEMATRLPIPGAHLFSDFLILLQTVLPAPYWRKRMLRP